MQNKLEQDQRARLREEQQNKLILEKILNEKQDQKRHDDLMTHLKSKMETMQKQMMETILR